MWSASAGAAYRSFLSQLKAAMRANDHRSLIGMTAFPLRVNSARGARVYRDAQSLERDFDRMFTPRVRSAILKQRPDQLFVRDQGAMIGNGELWFDQECPNAGPSECICDRFGHSAAPGADRGSGRNLC